jgi:hypothetical protein
MSVNFRKGAYYPGTTQNQTTTSTGGVTNAFGHVPAVMKCRK